MAIVLDRDKTELAIKKLIGLADEMEKARVQMVQAKAAYEDAWQEMLDKAPDYVDLNDLPERAIVQDGAWLYEVKFDFEEFTPPTIKRIDTYTRLVKID